MTNSDKETLMKNSQEILSNPLGTRMAISENNFVHIGNFYFRIFKDNGLEIDQHASERQILGKSFFKIDDSNDAVLIDGPLVCPSVPTGFVQVMTDENNQTVETFYRSFLDSHEFQLTAAKTKFCSFVETKEGGQELVLALIGSRFFVFEPNGLVRHEAPVLTRKGKPFVLFKPHVLRTSPNANYLLIYDQHTKRRHMLRMRDNESLVMEQELGSEGLEYDEIEFRAATQVDNDGNIWQVTYTPLEEDVKQFKIRVNQSFNLMAGEGFPAYFRKFMERNGVSQFDPGSQVILAVLDNYLAVTCTDGNAEVFCLPIDRHKKERKGPFTQLDLPVSDEWVFQQIEPCIAPNRCQIFFYNKEEDISSLLIWDLEKNLEDRQVQVRCKAYPRRGMNSPLNYCDGLKHFYDVEYAMELAHFKVPKDFSRTPSSNEVVISELKDLMVSRFKDRGVRVLCSTSTL